MPANDPVKSTIKANGHPPGANIQFWAVLDLLVQRWRWMALGALVFGALGLAAGLRFVGPKFMASAQLLRYETPGTSDFLTPKTPMSPETFGGLMLAPDLLRRVGSNAVPPIPADILIKQVKVEPDDESDIVNVSLAATNPTKAVELLNSYLAETIKYMTNLEAQEARVAAENYLGKQVAAMDQDIATLDHEFRSMALPPPVTNKLAEVGGQLRDFGTNLSGAPYSSALVAAQADRLNKAMGELTDLLSQYTELHPAVQQKEAEIKALKSEMAQEKSQGVTPAPVTSTPQGGPMSAYPGAFQPFNPELDIVRSKLLSLDQGRVELVNRQREAQLYLANPPGNCRVLAPASMKTVRESFRRVKIAILCLAGMVFGFCGSLFVVVLIEVADGRLKTADDVKRVTKLPILTTLGDLDAMDTDAQSQWAFRTWTRLQGRLSPSVHHGLICGVTSCSEGEGRSTWIRLLADAATMTGFRVLTIATRPSTVEPKPPTENGCDLLEESLQPKDPADLLTPVVVRDALSSPGKVADHFASPDSKPMVHIPLPGWVWNLERRRQWQEALAHWGKLDNVVIFVELPPADAPETVLLSSSLPNLVWLSESGVADAEKTRDQLETLRDARCNVVGAVLNKETARPLKKRLPRWIACGTIAALCACHGAQAQDTNLPAAADQTNLSFAVVNPSQRAEWQKHLTLGPGDVLDLGLFGQPELASMEIAIGPDGRISYLEAQDVLATGLTIDELRGRLDDELGKYRRAPHTMITPVAFHSKKYFMLGKITVKGAYTLDRPMTVLEAIARAKGFENGLINRSVVDLADFSRSFIARDGKRIPLNFEKLFESGDLSQNIPIEPNDYVYIAAVNLQEVYVVGEVRLPGPVTYTPGRTIISAITERGGFTERGYPARVVVVRGSLNHPQAFAVNVAHIERGDQTDFQLQAKDIIYVSARPFIRVEELADLAATAFIQGMITSWVDTKVVQPFTE
ncbi:MAG TPA: polysaccharide biosynthesis/export family protein [Verrucomicrobiae bacterium]|nr:polysaccharide biosynthesis/export family protein [Verrucomicrobiae bacterium]